MDKSNHAHIAKAYNEYYGNGLYANRYPKANPNVTDRVLTHTAPLTETSNILDYGCGNGRYLQQVLEHTLARTIGFDVSEVAIQQAKNQLQPYQFRVSLFSSRNTLNRALLHTSKVDVALLLFGVLAHIEGKENRREVLSWLFEHLKSGYGHLLVSVPNRLRRFWWLQLKVYFLRSPKTKEGICYERGGDSQKISLYYHLYTCKELIEELEDVGFVIRRVSAESFFPEKWVIRYSWLARLDWMLCEILPAWIGYGILVEARRPL